MCQQYFWWEMNREYLFFNTKINYSLLPDEIKSGIFTSLILCQHTHKEGWLRLSCCDGNPIYICKWLKSPPSKSTCICSPSWVLKTRRRQSNSSSFYPYLYYAKTNGKRGRSGWTLFGGKTGVLWRFLFTTISKKRQKTQGCTRPCLGIIHVRTMHSFNLKTTNLWS